MLTSTLVLLLLLQSCTQNSDCATLPVCGYCDTQQGTCINNMVTGAQCQVGDEYGSCANGDCEVREQEMLAASSATKKRINQPTITMITSVLAGDDGCRISC